MGNPEAGAKPRAGFFDVWLIGLALAGAFALYLAGTAGIIGRYNDDSFYALAAKSLAEGGLAGLETMRADPSRFPIGFSAFLAGLWILAGRDYSAVPVWEVSVGLQSVAFHLGSYLLLTRIWGVNRLAAAIAVLLVAFHPVTVKYSAAVMSDLPCAAFTAGALAILEAVRRRPGSKWLPVAAGLALGLCFVTRYAALVLVAAAALAFLWERRAKAACVVSAVAACVAAPWVIWVAQHKAYGYADEYVRSAGTRSYGGSLLDGLSWLVFETLPGLLLPQPFLRGIETSDPAPAEVGPLMFAGLALAGLLLAACVAEVTNANRRLPALFALGTVLLIALWAGRFPKLGWDLQIRLLLPVAPFMLAFAFERAAWEVLKLPERRRAAFALVAVLALSCAAFADVRLAGDQVERTAMQSRDFLRGLLAARSYLAKVPLDVRVGTLYTAQASFYIPRRFEAVLPSVAGLREARSKGIRLILATPHYVGDRDVMRDTVYGMTEGPDPEARVLFAPTDNVAVVHLPVARTQPRRDSRLSPG